MIHVLERNLIKILEFENKVRDEDKERYGAFIFLCTQVIAKIKRDKIEGEELIVIGKKLEEQFETLLEALLKDFNMKQ